MKKVSPRTKATPIRTLYQSWLETRRRYNEGGPESLFVELVRLEDRILATPPATVEDYAYKILVADTEGDMNTNTFQVGMVREARALIERLANADAAQPRINSRTS